ncbi:MAG: uridine kinase [SAR324 cluster bacterium]|uniref:uridine/cytidine kinase n=1 Tax=SAR324 cluster bacterium TaxID=2024889 RepID=A0A7X9IIZ8_9DELT|nr:uridine kinase [SAR324 cluster bacterium]
MVANIKAPFVIGVAGGTASGKTYFCNALKKRLPPSSISVLCLDWYYHSLDEKTLEERAKFNFDHPDSLELDLAAQHIKILKSGFPVECPQYDFSIHTRKPERVVLQPTPLILVEGILTLYSNEIRELLDLKIFIDASDELRFNRRLRRDVQDRGRSPESVKWQWDTTVQPMYLEYCKSSSAYADKILIGGEIDIDSLLKILPI